MSLLTLSFVINNKKPQSKLFDLGQAHDSSSADVVRTLSKLINVMLAGWDSRRFPSLQTKYSNEGGVLFKVYKNAGYIAVMAKHRKQCVLSIVHAGRTVHVSSTGGNVLSFQFYADSSLKKEDDFTLEMAWDVLVWLAGSVEMAGTFLDSKVWAVTSDFFLRWLFAPEDMGDNVLSTLYSASSDFKRGVDGLIRLPTPEDYSFIGIASSGKLHVKNQADMLTLLLYRKFELASFRWKVPPILLVPVGARLIYCNEAQALSTESDQTVTALVENLDPVRTPFETKSIQVQSVGCAPCIGIPDVPATFLLLKTNNPRVYRLRGGYPVGQHDVAGYNSLFSPLIEELRRENVTHIASTCFAGSLLAAVGGFKLVSRDLDKGYYSFLRKRKGNEVMATDNIHLSLNDGCIYIDTSGLVGGSSDEK